MSGDALGASDVAARIRDCRLAAGLSQQAVADAVYIQRPAYSLLERGKRKVTAGELRALARLFGVPVGFFFGEWL
jgi:transcriptional regulator with XRE-family HTH domain